MKRHFCAMGLLSLFQINSVFADDNEAFSKKWDLSYVSSKTSSQQIDIERISPFINGIKVEGADSIILYKNNIPEIGQESNLIPEGEFRLRPEDAIAVALSSVKGALIIDPFVEKLLPITQKIWLMHYENLRPTYKVRIPTLRLKDLKNIWVDAETGDVLKRELVAKWADAPADVYTKPPAISGPTISDLQPVELTELLSATPGSFLNGNFIQTRNCCARYQCKTGASACDNESDRICAISGGIQNSILVKAPSDIFGLKGDPFVYLSSVRCAELPYAQACDANNCPKEISSSAGFFAVPVDGASELAEIDAFAEIQSYYSTMSFFEHIRELLGDPTWCLRKQAMSCDSLGRPVLDTNNLPTKVFRVFVNQLIPDLKIDQAQKEDPNFFDRQISEGRGSQTNPVVIDKFMRLENAAFVPGSETAPTQLNSVDELLLDFNRPYDHLLLFQGEKTDFAYDVSVVQHEFMHAVTQTLSPDLDSQGLDSWGSNVQPGSMNEAWSDYFTASKSNSPTIGAYASRDIRNNAEIGLRNLADSKSCPDSMINEVHEDSQILSSALWAIRTSIYNTLGQDGVNNFDHNVLLAIAQSVSNENYKSHTDHIAQLISNNPKLGPDIANQARAIFVAQGLSDCRREFELSSVNADNEAILTEKQLFFLPAPADFGLINFVPAPGQLKLTMPRGADAFKITWNLFFGSDNNLVASGAVPSIDQLKKIRLVVNEGTPIDWRYINRLSQPTVKGLPIPFDTENEASIAYLNNDGWEFIHEFTPDFCKTKTFYVSALSLDYSYVMQGIKAQIATVPSPDNVNCAQSIAGAQSSTSGSGCSCKQNDQASNLTLYILVTIAACTLRLRKKVTQ